MSSERFQILSLSGGGYRGLYTAAALAALEEKTGRPIGQCFELIAGTSIGGIIALAVAFEVEMSRVIREFTEAGPKIFPGPKATKPTIVGRLRRRYAEYHRPSASADSVRVVVASLFGQHTKLREAKHPVVIPAVNLTKGKPQVFKTRHYEGVHRDTEYSVVDIALATSAAPTFFPPAGFDNCLFADGGLFANSPDLVGYHEATHFLDIAREHIHMLSVGTTTAKYSIVEDGHNGYGTGFWVVDEERRLPNILISAQQQFAEQITAHLLGERYFRLDTEPSREQVLHLGLDKATPIATKTLLGLGKQAATDLLGQEAMRALLTHEAAAHLLAEEA